jgi:sortase A
MRLAPVLAAGLTVLSSASVGAAVRKEGQRIARLQIPRIGLEVVVLEGVADATLHRGSGHVPKTAWPAPGRRWRGNCVITGHRDSFFLPLRAAHAGDLVRLVDTSGSTRSFRLTSKRIVSDEAYWVTDQTGRPRLTLITCYPFRWKGSAPYRLVWTAVPVAPERASRAQRADAG